MTACSGSEVNIFFSTSELELTPCQWVQHIGIQSVRSIGIIWSSCVRCRSISPFPRRCCFRPMFLHLLVRENCVCMAHRHTARLTGVHTQKDARGFSSRGCGNRRTQVRQPTLNHKGAEIVSNSSSKYTCSPVFKKNGSDDVVCAILRSPTDAH